MTGVLTKRTESQAVQMTLGGKGIAKKMKLFFISSQMTQEYREKHQRGTD